MKKTVKDYKIGTLGSHSALQILKGARDEGFKNVVYCLDSSTVPYRSYRVADEIVELRAAIDGEYRVEHAGAGVIVGAAIGVDHHAFGGRRFVAGPDSTRHQAAFGRLPRLESRSEVDQLNNGCLRS